MTLSVKNSKAVYVFKERLEICICTHPLDLHRKFKNFESLHWWSLIVALRIYKKISDFWFLLIGPIVCAKQQCAGKRHGKPKTSCCDTILLKKDNKNKEKLFSFVFFFPQNIALLPVGASGPNNTVIHLERQQTQNSKCQRSERRIDKKIPLFTVKPQKQILLKNGPDEGDVKMTLRRLSALPQR